MRRIDLNDGWAFRIWGRPGSFPVFLPHDYSQYLPRRAGSKSGSAGGFFQGANLIYDRELTVTPDMAAGRAVVEFEGVSANAEVYLDDRLLVRQPNPSLSFHADLTPFLRPGTLRLRVNAHHDALPDARWYTGTGMYRPVHLLLSSTKAAILPWGVFAAAEGGPGDWRVKAEISVTPEAAGHTLRCLVEDEDGGALAEAECPVSGEKNALCFPVPGAEGWSPDAPRLYRLVCRLEKDGACVDEAGISIGFRTVALNPEKGLLLNGVPVKLRGGCVHHDNGILGAESYPDAEYRKALLLKEHGFNAVRCAHTPPAPAFLDACDRVGLLVMDEFADQWNIGKNPYDEHLHFASDWRRNLRAMILRDRNHPSVIFWSIGNEIPERDGSCDGYAQCRRMCDTVREWDGTRLVTAALNNIGKRRLEALDANLQSSEGDEIDYFDVLSAPFLAPLDVAGYNYLGGRYEKDLAAHPERFICGTESVARESLAYWRKTTANPRILGDFAWTALDYLGEAGIGHVWYAPEDGEGYFERWPFFLGNCGDLDLLGVPNPCHAYRQAVWGTLDAPYLAVQHPAHWRDDGNVSYWGWPERFSAWDFPGYEGRNIRVDVYTQADAATLFLNGREIASARCVDCVATFDCAYMPGVLQVRDSLGREACLRTPGPAKRLMLQHERTGSLCFVSAYLVDEAGVICSFDRRRISFSVRDGRLLACGSADPRSTEGFRRSGVHAFRGMAAAVLEPGAACSLRCGAAGLPSVSVSL